MEEALVPEDVFIQSEFINSYSIINILGILLPKMIALKMRTRSAIAQSVTVFKVSLRHQGSDKMAIK